MATPTPEPELPPSIAAYVDGMVAHDWKTVRASLADDCVRVGPFPEHKFIGADVYVAFLADVLPGVENHTITVDRWLTVGDLSYVEITERLTRDGAPVESRVCLACDLAPDGKLLRIEGFLRRTG